MAAAAGDRASDPHPLAFAHSFQGRSQRGLRKFMSAFGGKRTHLEGEGAIRGHRRPIMVRCREKLEEIAADAYGFPEAQYSRLITPFGRSTLQSQGPISGQRVSPMQCCRHCRRGEAAAVRFLPRAASGQGPTRGRQDRRAMLPRQRPSAPRANGSAGSSQWRVRKAGRAAPASSASTPHRAA